MIRNSAGNLALHNSTYRILISPRAARDLKKLGRTALKRIDKAILKLAVHPHPSGTRKIIANDIAQYRIRIGDYRILYDVDESAKTVVILRIGHRREIYR